MIKRNSKAPLSCPSTAYTECIAKTFKANDGSIQKGRSVFNHCQIVGEVAREIIRRLPSNAIQALFPVGSPFIAASHDVGKVSPTFYNKIMTACGGELISGFDPMLEKHWDTG